MAEKTENASELTLDEQAMFSLAVEANLIQRNVGEPVIIDGKVWYVRKTSMRQNQKMLNLDFDIFFWQKRLKADNIGRREAKRLNTKIRKAYAKKAAYKIVGYRLWWIPFFYALTWWRIYNASEKVSSTLNTEEAIGRNRDFF